MSQATKPNTYNNANNNVPCIGGTEQPKQETRCDNGVSGNEGSSSDGGRW